MNGSYDINKEYNITNDNQFMQEVFQWLVNNHDDTIVVVWDQSNEIVFSSKLFHHLINLYAVQSDNWRDYFPQYHVKEIIEHYNTSNEAYHIPNLRHKHDGEIFECSCIIDQIAINNELFFICKLKDITDINYFKNIVLETDKLLCAAEFSAGLVHEIRNPLTSLKGFIQLVQAGINQKEKYYDVMNQEVEKLEKITSELLLMAKPFKNNFSITSVEEMIHDVLFLMNGQSTMKSVNIILQLENNLQINCNSSQIKQILINLIKNGSEAMKMNGVLQISSYRSQENVIIEVIDQGEGIPSDKIRELNKPFYSTKEDGTGLGLMITQHILDLHHGKLEVYSEVNRSTTFRVILPIKLNLDEI